MGRIGGVIFDLDETLIDSLGTYTEAVNAGIGLFGLDPVTRQTIARFLDRGIRLGEMLLELYPDALGDSERRLKCQDEIMKAYLALAPEKVTLKQGAQGALLALKERGVKIGVVTGRMTAGESRWLELHRLGIRNLVDAMVTAADAPAKPAPDGVTKCIEELGLSAGECVFVGDSRVDIRAGREAGVRTVAVDAGVAAYDLLLEQEPDRVIADLDLLLPCLDQMEETKED